MGIAELPRLVTLLVIGGDGGGGRLWVFNKLAGPGAGGGGGIRDRVLEAVV